MNLFNLVAKLGFDSSEFKKGLADSKKNASEFASKVGTVMKGAAKAFTAVTATVGAVASAVVALGVKMVDLGGEIDDNAQRLGLSTEQYQLWSFAMTKAGTDVSTLQRGMIQLGTWTENLAKGQADALKTLDDLGLGYEEFTALDNAGQLEAITNALQGMEDQTEKARLAQELFGDRVGQQLMPLFNEEQGSIAELNETLREQGVIVGDENIQAAAKLGDKIDLLKSTFTSFGLKLATDVFPEIGQLIDGFQELATGSENASETIASALTGVVNKVVDMLPELLDGVVTLLFKLLDGIIPIIPQLAEKLFDICTDVLDDLVGYVPQLLDMAGNLIIDIVDKLTNYAPTLVNILIELIIDVVQAAITIFPQLVKSIGELLETLIEALFSEKNIGVILDMLLEFVFALAEFLIDDLPTILDKVGTALFNGIANLFSEKNLKKMGNLAVNLGIALVNGIIRGLNNLAYIRIPGLKIGSWQVWDDVDVQLFNIPQIAYKKYKDGGMFEDLFGLAKGTAYAVAGEDGAEIVAQGRHGTGVANVEQIAEAVEVGQEPTVMAIRQAVGDVVNGIVNGLGMRSRSSEEPVITVQIGEKDFKSYIVKTVNETLNARGRKNLNAITAY